MDAEGKNKVGEAVEREAGESDDEGYCEPYNNMAEVDRNGTCRKMKEVVVKKAGRSGGGGGTGRNCQVEKCTANLNDAKLYHRRHKVCEVHAKAQVVVVAGIRQRFCQQCSRFHELPEFDESKRSCRRRLAGHNERRRKNAAESNGEGSNRRGIGT